MKQNFHEKLAFIKSRTALYLNDSQTRTGKIVEIILLGFNLAACFLYVASTYENRMPGWLIFLDVIVAVEFIIEYLLRIWTAEKKCRYLFSFYGIIDLVTILPSLVLLPELGFLRILKVLKVLRILRFLRFFENRSFFFGTITPIQLQACRTIFTIFILLFSSSGFILFAESFNVSPQIQTFGEAFYFCVITLSTVGFGDFIPVTPWGRAVTTIMIMFGAILIPWQAGKLIRMLSRESGKIPSVCQQCGLKGHDPDASHCRACGAVIFQEYEGNSD
jgi:voltage-gated potassium channel